MNTSTMDESTTGSALFTTADLAKTSPNTNSMSLLSLTNAVVRGSAASGTPFPVVSSTCGGGDEQSSQELKVSDLSNVAGLKKVAKHVGEESHSKKSRSKSLSPRRESKARDLSNQRRISKSRELSPRRESSVRNNTKGKGRRGERSFDVKAAASMLASPNAKGDKASAAAAFLLSTTQAAATTRSVSPDLGNHRARHRPHHHKKEDNHHHQGLDSRSRHNNKEDRRRSKSEHRRSVPVKEDNSLDRRSEHHHKKPNSRLPRRSQSDDGAEPDELKRERIRRRHHHHHQHHNRRTQSQPEGSMTKPPNVKPRRVASQPEGGALEEAAAQVVHKGRTHRGNGRSVRGPRSGGGARGMGNVQLQQVLKTEINTALEVELEDDVVLVRPPPPTRIEKGMDLNTVDLTSLDADAVNKLLAQSMHNNSKSGETTTTHKTTSSSSNIVLPMTASKQTSTSRRNRMGISKRASGSNRHLTAERKAKHSDLSDDSEDEFA